MYPGAVEQIVMFIGFGYVAGAGLFGCMCIVVLLRFRPSDTPWLQFVKRLAMFLQLVVYVIGMVHIGRELIGLPDTPINDVSVLAFMATALMLGLPGIWWAERIGKALQQGEQ